MEENRLLRNSIIRENGVQIYLIVSIVIISFFSYQGNDRFATLFSFVFYIVGLVFDPILPLCISLGTAPVALATNSGLALFKWMIICLPAFYFFVIRDKHKMRAKDFCILFAKRIVLHQT